MVLSRIHTLFKERLFTIVYVLYMIILQYYGIYQNSMVLPPVLRSQGQSQILSSHTLYGRALNVLYKNMYDSKDGWHWWPCLWVSSLLAFPVWLSLLEEARSSPAGRACDISPMHQNTTANISLTSRPTSEYHSNYGFSHTTHWANTSSYKCQDFSRVRAVSSRML